jgi:hypothetical protein
VDLELEPGSTNLLRRPTTLVEQFRQATEAGMPPVGADATTTTEGGRR